VYTFQFGHFATPENGPRWQMALKFAELVEQETNGAVKIEVFPANQLVKVKETVTAVGQGRWTVPSMWMPTWWVLSPPLSGP
jgi:TRAP-type C4-dicarboxylate transport system substrate-binding protein